MTSATPAKPDAIGRLRDSLSGLYRPWMLWAVLLVQAGLWLGLADNSWRASPDSGLYLGLGRSLAQGQGYVFNHQFHSMVPPGYPLFLAAVMKLFGESFLAMNLSQLATGLACTPVAFLLLRRWFGADLGILGALVFALSYALWDTAGVPLSDFLFTSLAMLGMLCVAAGVPTEGGAPTASQARRWLAVLAGGLVLGCAGLVRVNGVVVIPGVVAAIWIGWRGRSRLERAGACLLVAAMTAAPVLAWQAYANAMRTPGERNYLDASYLAKPLGEMARLVFYNLLVDLPSAMSDLIANFGGIPVVASLVIPAAVVTGAAICLRRRQALLPLGLVGMSLMLLIAPGVRLRYLFFLQPGLIVLAIVGASAWAGKLSPAGWLTAGRLRRGAVVAAGILAVIGVAHSSANTWKQRRGAVPGGHRLADRQGWFAAAAWLREHEPDLAGGRGERVVVMTRQPSILFYLTGALCLPTQPGPGSASKGVRETIHPQDANLRPAYLLSETDDPRTDLILQTLHDIGARAETVEGVKMTGKIGFWRVRYAETTTFTAATTTAPASAFPPVSTSRSTAFTSSAP
jgi:4-amino-4-deoxy-L-arabinose transferase-like glycosyltransferase